VLRIHLHHLRRILLLLHLHLQVVEYVTLAQRESAQQTPPGLIIIKLGSARIVTQNSLKPLLTLGPLNAIFHTFLPRVVIHLMEFASIPLLGPKDNTSAGPNQTKYGGILFLMASTDVTLLLLE